ncbi:MAG: RsmE family RNA methyltransferase [Candidatus Cloacimonadales bacterium]|jgi:16S rRNA (uracil1498-N3)-methyltransferase|nr:16S rRNA (uracil(1498)-N(3))-methyltransferase [Candidatus Cloacimonadota bacterium]MDY0380853.1 RsmE family RNA methyltransferase [Candidatus Cloacimonadaceae bacterium]HCM15897.1 hypothetical protein [Candidatus Cloacimonas sp.]MCB5256001.1 16S rRNA (uracil(1498)-N(3))-methyltransferase [Candidatus Cloacimonadota bacterium]MCB5263867.1 16S rRNA (uracil(1498)-N(3))-methyltransferase [Candidatus Cloacimonadota bacterium]
MPSYYYPLLTADSREIILQDEEFHHLCKVKRVSSGSIVKINGGNGIIAECRVTSIEKRRAVLEAFHIKEHPVAEKAFAIAFALLKNKHDELAVEKCTEMGASDFFPLQTEFTVRDENRNTVSRFEKIALAAIKQCDNPYLPAIHPIHNLAKAIAYIEERGYLPVVCSEIERDKWLHDLGRIDRPCFIVGPEGGFSSSEMALMQSLASISISKLILRAETAAICIASQYQLFVQTHQI